MLCKSLKFCLIATAFGIAFSSFAEAQSCVCKAVLQMPNGNQKTFCHAPPEHPTSQAACATICNGDGTLYVWGTADDIREACTSGPTIPNPTLRLLSHKKNHWQFACSNVHESVKVAKVRSKKDAVFTAAKMCLNVGNVESMTDLKAPPG